MLGKVYTFAKVTLTNSIVQKIGIVVSSAKCPIL